MKRHYKLEFTEPISHFYALCKNDKLTMSSQFNDKPNISVP